MTNILLYKASKRYITLSLLLISFALTGYAQAQTTIQGIILDSLTMKPMPSVTIHFEGTKLGAFSKNDGSFRLSNTSRYDTVVISTLGYQTVKFAIPVGQTTTKKILLHQSDQLLNEVVVKPKKEKYSKKNNPAVDLILKVIKHKNENNINSLDYYEYEEYERLVMALNDFKPNQPQFRRYKFLPKYIDTSLIDNKKILPLSVRERVSDVYYRKEPETRKQIIKGSKLEGVDQSFDTEGMDAVFNEMFKNINIYDNSIILMFNNFVGPLNEHRSTNYYKWYIEDTVMIDNQRYINLSFVPFNGRDISFTGDLFISTDGTYGVKKAVLRAPRKLNLNFVSDMVIVHDFKQNEYGKWVPDEQTMAMDLSMIEAVKTYIEKTRSFNNIKFNKPANDSIYNMGDPINKVKNYHRQPKDFWVEHRPVLHRKDYKMDEMMKDLDNISFIKAFLKAGELMMNGYFATNKDEDKNKIDIGAIPTFYSYNKVEGNRFKVTAVTNRNMHPHLFLYGYAAYGTRDNKMKYMAEATWRFNKSEKHKDEYPKSNLTVSHAYDMNSLGQKFTQAARDHILMSLRSGKKQKMTYSRTTKLSYFKEYHNGLSGGIVAQVLDERPAGRLTFDKIDALGNKTNIKSMKATELMFNIEYAPNRVFFQQRRNRMDMPTQALNLNLSHAVGLKFLGGNYKYNRTEIGASKEFWMTPYGKLKLSAKGEKIWGIVPFPLLITASSNSSYTIQKGSFYLLEPLEFVHDKQISWEVYYHMGGWLFNRIPIVKMLKWREVFGFRGFYGGLRKANNPAYNPNLMQFPEDTYVTHNKPYMEMNVGIENIFNFFRIDYVRRLNYLEHEGAKKHGFRVSFEFSF